MRRLRKPISDHRPRGKVGSRYLQLSLRIFFILCPLHLFPYSFVYVEECNYANSRNSLFWGSPGIDFMVVDRYYLIKTKIKIIITKVWQTPAASVVLANVGRGAYVSLRYQDQLLHQLQLVQRKTASVLRRHHPYWPPFEYSPPCPTEGWDHLLPQTLHLPLTDNLTADKLT